MRQYIELDIDGEDLLVSAELEIENGRTVIGEQHVYFRNKDVTDQFSIAELKAIADKLYSKLHETQKADNREVYEYLAKTVGEG